LPVSRQSPGIAGLKSYRYLVKQIDERISQVDCVIVIAGPYVEDSDWVQSEMEAAKDFEKPLIAVSAGEPHYENAASSADVLVIGWQKEIIISSIRHLVDRRAAA
jgi:hypothetical protein